MLFSKLGVTSFQWPKTLGEGHSVSSLGEIGPCFLAKRGQSANLRRFPGLRDQESLMWPHVEAKEGGGGNACLIEWYGTSTTLLSSRDSEEYTFPQHTQLNKISQRVAPTSSIIKVVKDVYQFHNS